MSAQPSNVTLDLEAVNPSSLPRLQTAWETAAELNTTEYYQLARAIPGYAATTAAWKSSDGLDWFCALVFQQSNFYGLVFIALPYKRGEVDKGRKVAVYSLATQLVQEVDLFVAELASAFEKAGG